MDLNNIDWEHMAKVALGGAVTAVITDYLYSHYGDKASGIMTEIKELVAQLLDTPTPPTVGGEV